MKERENLFNTNCYMSLKKKREKFRQKLVQAIRRKQDADEKKGHKKSLITDEDTQLLRYYHYISHGIGDVHITPIDTDILCNILSLVPDQWQKKYPDVTDRVAQEIKENYIFSMKKGIIDFVLEVVSADGDKSAQVVE